MPDPNHFNLQHEPALPYVLIPYFAGDYGTRPLPVPYFTCPGLHVGGSSYAGTPLTPGSTLSLSAQVINYGHASAAEVAFYWADPSTAFTKSALHLIGLTALYLPWKVLTETKPVSWKLKDEVPAHVCLLAEVTALGDPPTVPLNAAADRHYAQQNLQVLRVAPGTEAFASFFAANPGTEPAWISLSARPGKHDLLAQLTTVYNLSPIEIPPSALRLFEGEIDTGPNAPVAEMRIELQPGEKRRVQVGFLVPGDLDGHFIALTLQQESATGTVGDLLTGAIGIVAMANHTSR